MRPVAVTMQALYSGKCHNVLFLILEHYAFMLQWRGKKNWSKVNLHRKLPPPRPDLEHGDHPLGDIRLTPHWAGGLEIPCSLISIMYLVRRFEVY